MLLPTQEKKNRKFAYIYYLVYTYVVDYILLQLYSTVYTTVVYTTRLYINTIQYVYNYTVYI
jgi:hypothetical protein